MVKFRTFSRLKNIFTRLNPSNSFNFDEWDVEVIKPPSSDDLLKKAINDNDRFEKVILMAIYHLINTQGVNEEYLTVLTKDLRLISDLVKCEKDTVRIPENLKSEPSSNILLTCHNHFQKAIIPSTRDLQNAFKPNIKFTIIVSDDQIGILINDLGEKFFNFDDDELKLFKETWKCFSDYIVFCLNQEKPNEVLKFYLVEDESDEIKEEFQKIYDEFVGDNIDKFVNEFNVRYEKYNIYFIHIKM